MPEPAQGGEHELLCISWRDIPDEEVVVVGSWVMSGMESHRMRRLFEPDLTATQTFCEMNNDAAEIGVDWFGGAGDVGSSDNSAWPE